MSELKDLVQIIRNNPGCVAVIDNDCWELLKEDPDTTLFDFEAATENECDEWHEANVLVTHDEIEPLGDGGYGSGNCYGGDILQALAAIVGIKVQSV
jgi:hypothetical protein